MDAIKLVYFHLRGRAEMIRLMLEAAGQEYEEERVQFGDWLQRKPDAPFGSLPYIEYQGKRYGQSIAIATFIAKQLGFYGKTNLDALRIDEISWLWEDQLTSNLTGSRWAKDEKVKAEHRRKTLEEDLPKFFGFYERLLGENNGNGHFVGDSNLLLAHKADTAKVPIRITATELRRSDMYSTVPATAMRDVLQRRIELFETDPDAAECLKRKNLK
ncbi:hypothetical protein C0Q70_15760 [Pomacea canaliculata]|uniref:GST N-terminal domain-containing protein n=1 Tax=Pomacea canaliculata TaxID=400727 RepID=A0A2T7NVR9_POMCA|nr:hypothetical protein C0Q70_15760 [Pomacea canaliculata]